MPPATDPARKAKTLTLDHPWLTGLVAQLGLEEKVHLLTGRDQWHTQPLPRIGLRSMRLSDGPVGVRGETWDERRPSPCLPSATVLAATWDPGLALAYGAALAAEARHRDVDVVLAPTVNLHRSPLAGRHFEAFSEDPVLTGAMAAAVVAGLQAGGVGATVKHYVANDYETERHTASSEVPEQALHEVYLRAFEQPLVEGGAWLVMSAYNAVNGVPASESPLLTSPLRTEWGFDGLVVSDWSAVGSLAAAAADQDLVMPGPDGPWGPALVAAVRAGEVPEAAVDAKVRRLLLLAARVGALAGVAPSPVEAAPRGGTASVARDVAADGMVLLANDGLLPLDPGQLRRVAVIGHNAVEARIQGGGSATVVPTDVVSPLEGLVAALPGVPVDHAVGAVVQAGLAPLPLEEIGHPDSGEPGLLVRFLDGAGAELHREHRLATDLVWFGGDAPVRHTAGLELSFSWTPGRSGRVGLGFAAGGRGRIELDGEELLSGRGELTTPRLGASPLAPPSVSAPVSVAAGRTRSVVVRLEVSPEVLGPAGLLTARVGLAPPDGPPEALVEEAVGIARTADVAVVVVGTSPDVESEGFDRTTLALPGHQDALVRAVAATGTPTVVVVNAGAPVLLPWRDDVAAVVVPSFGGQELGHALADVLLGRVEPGGRLPTTWPGEQPPPVLDVTPAEGRLRYDEGVHVGYRAWRRDGLVPAYWFGHGLGYTTWEVDDLSVTGPTRDAPGAVEVTVGNTGARSGKQVVQVYASRPDSTVDRPALWLVGHRVVRLDAGARERISVPVTWRSLAHRTDDSWRVEPGTFEVLVGTSSADLPLRTTVSVP